MTGGEVLILVAIAMVVMVLWRSDKVADQQHEELKTQLHRLQLTLEGLAEQEAHRYRAILRRGATD